MKVEIKIQYLPPHRVQLADVLGHILVDVVGVDHRVEFESHLVVLAPAPDFEQVVEVALLTLGTADGLVGVLVETVTGDSQDVQVLSFRTISFTLELKMDGVNANKTRNHASVG